MNNQSEKLYRESIIIDGTCPLARYKDYWQLWISGKVTSICVTANSPSEMMRDTIRRLGVWFQKIRDNSEKLSLVTSVSDIYAAKSNNKLGIIFHFQGSTPIETDLNNLEIYHRLGIRILQLAYNVRNFIGDGSIEKTDCGLSDFGLKVINELNRLGITIDCSHTGQRTTMEAINASKRPVIVSHANARAVCDNRRNLTDDIIKAIARCGGVIGLNGYPGFVAKKARPTLDDLLNHADHIIKLVGVDHLSLGIDYYEGQAGVADNHKALEIYKSRIEDGSWDIENYPPPPWHFPKGIEMPDKLPNLANAFLKRKYSRKDIQKILGLNLIRVFKETWND